MLKREKDDNVKMSRMWKRVCTGEKTNPFKQKSRNLYLLFCNLQRQIFSEYTTLWNNRASEERYIGEYPI